MRIVLIEFLASTLILILPLFSGLFGLILARFLRLSMQKTIRVIAVFAAIGAPCPDFTGHRSTLVPSLMVILKMVNGIEVSLLNAVASVLSMSITGGGLVLVNKYTR